MWIYSALPSILILGGLRPIAPCPPPLPGGRYVTTILLSELRGPNRRSFYFSYAPTLTIGSTVGLLVGCSGGQFACTGQIADYFVVGRWHGFHRMQPSSTNNGIVRAQVLDN